MTSNHKTFILLLALVVVLGGAYLVYDRLAQNQAQVLTEEPNLPDNQDQPAQHQLAPDFTVVDQEGNSVALSDFRGQPVVINFWASWCPPCKGEMPDFEKVYQQRKDDLVFMMINMTDGQRETQEKGQAYIDQEGYTFPIYFDLDQSVAMAYGISAIPTTLFIDKEGYLMTGAQGAIDESTLLKGIGYIE